MGEANKKKCSLNGHLKQKTRKKTYKKWRRTLSFVVCSNNDNTKFDHYIFLWWLNWEKREPFNHLILRFFGHSRSLFWIKINKNRLLFICECDFLNAYQRVTHILSIQYSIYVTTRWNDNDNDNDDDDEEEEGENKNYHTHTHTLTRFEEKNQHQ